MLSRTVGEPRVAFLLYWIKFSRAFCGGIHNLRGTIVVFNNQHSNCDTTDRAIVLLDCVLYYLCGSMSEIISEQELCFRSM